ncbi:MAG: bifunctional sugar-1-phosphate nucleotidylyltransferase/acetyltransferase [Candidatus Thermoplasmatota archaeon]|nr:bifunctional sugar-1-phosphate nucleotidylyltransferase/acetyltransferase [Candidatus Thermoplasmatota archaeon]
MKCIILAAGEGKRMHPLTYTRPKVMLPIANKPILEWNLLNAIEAGLKEFIFVVGYKSEMVRNYFGNGKEWNVNIEYVNQGKALGTSHAIGMVEKFVDDFVVLCGDTIFGKKDIKNIAKKISMGLVKVEDAQEYGIVELDGKKIIKIYEKMERPFSNVINAGIYHFNKEIFDFVRKTGKSLRGEYEITDSINLLLEKDEMEGIFLDEWMDAVYPWHLLEGNEELLKKMDGNVEGIVEKNVAVKGKVSVGKGSIIMDGSYIEGPVVIGNNCKIGPNCYIRSNTTIGKNCRIGNACEVKNSIVMDGSNVPHQNYVGDSVIGSNCNLGAGTKIANLRMDKKNIEVYLNGKKIDIKRRKLGSIMGDDVQTGINSMVNAGTIIGNNVFIGPGAMANGEIRPDARIM